jgi:receptor-type tyrosine-protein phosphatase gamma
MMGSVLMDFIYIHILLQCKNVRLYYNLSQQVLEGERTEWTTYVTVNTAAADTVYTVANLRPFTVYSFRVIGVNRIGASPPSLPSYHMMTLRETPRGKPLIVRVQNLSASSVSVTWRAPDNDTIHGEFLGYRLNWRPRDATADTGETEV